MPFGSTPHVQNNIEDRSKGWLLSKGLTTSEGGSLCDFDFSGSMGQPDSTLPSCPWSRAEREVDAARSRERGGSEHASENPTKAFGAPPHRALLRSPRAPLPPLPSREEELQLPASVPELEATGLGVL